VDVPLSDNEQRLLEQMERALYAEDPKFATAMRGSRRNGGAGRRLAIGIGGILLGLVVLLVGVMKGLVLVGAIGFVLMLAGTTYAVSSHRKSGPTGVAGGTAAAPAAKGKRRSKGSFMQRLDERWDRRREGR
jgi:hypothetical protein